jgi:hypothetical protein
MSTLATVLAHTLAPARTSTRADRTVEACDGLAFGFLLILARAHIARSFWAMPPWLELRATPGYLKVARLTCAFVGPFTAACYASLLLILVPERFGKRRSRAGRRSRGLPGLTQRWSVGGCELAAQWSHYAQRGCHHRRLLPPNASFRHRSEDQPRIRDHRWSVGAARATAAPRPRKR